MDIARPAVALPAVCRPPRTALARLLRPSLGVRCIWEVDLGLLRDRGIRGLILDLDNTLVDWEQEYLRPEASRWLAQARERGLGLCIATNARRRARVARVAAAIGASYVLPAGKPLPSAYRRAMACLGTAPAQTAMIGDQIFTDIAGANRLGLFTVLVRPLSWREFPATKLARMAEWAVLRWLPSARPPKGPSP